MSASEFIDMERAVALMLVAACSGTKFGLYYPDADVVIRWRHGKVLPVVEINRKVEIRETQVAQKSVTR